MRVFISIFSVPTSGSPDPKLRVDKEVVGMSEPVATDVTKKEANG